MGASKGDVLVGGLRVGDTLAGRYLLERELGAGGMGVVVAARRLVDGQRVAVKLLLMPRSNQAEKQAARLLREAKATASLSDEHVVRLHDVDKLEDGTCFLVMEMLDGMDLASYVQAQGPLSIPEATDLLLQACAGVAEAHVRGIVHRDLKPHNLFLTRRPMGSPIVKVLDFGISKMDDGDDAPLTTTGSSLGSPHYMSIEQFRNARAVDRRSDIWALGMILHHLLTGRTAYEADNVATYLFKLSVEPPAPIRTQRPDIPETIEAIILRCLEKNPDARFNTVGEFAAAIAPFATPRSQDALRRIAQYTSFTPTIAAANVLLENLLATGERPVVSASTNSNTAEGVTHDALGSTSHWNRRSSVGLALILVACLGGVTSGGYLSTRHAAPQNAGQVQTSAPVTHTTSSIILRINVNPPDAIIELDGNVVTSPVEIPKGDTERELVVHADGYTMKKKKIQPSTDAYLEITLDKLAKPATSVPAFVESATSKDRKTPTKTTNTEKIKVKGPMTDSL